MHRDTDFVCVPVQFEGEYLWCVFEKATDQVIRHFYFEEEALDYIDFLVKGGCFAGHTPTFMSSDFTTKKLSHLTK